MNSINTIEFTMLQGTDIMVNFIRNRVVVPVELASDVDDYMTVNSTGLYHSVSQPNQTITVYCEMPIDAEHLRLAVNRSQKS